MMMKDSNRLVLMDQDRIERSANRIAHQIREDNREDRDIELLGINERGYAVACLLQEKLASLTGLEVNCFQLLLKEQERIKGAPRLDDTYVLLVDDVVFSGTTMFRALMEVSRNTLPTEIHSVALIDRGHRRFPVGAKFVGMELPTKLDEHVAVELQKDRPAQVLLHQSMY